MNRLFRLSDVELENSLGVHISNERMSLDHIYQHINEVYRRELHLDIQYGNMKTYLVKRWKYSEREAYRKIEGARLLKDVPGLAEEIRNGNLNADVISEVSRAVKEKERVSGEKVSAAVKSELVAMVSGKSAPDSQRELAIALDVQVKQFESKRVQKDNSVRLEFTISEELNARLQLCRDHASHKIQQQKLSQNLEGILTVLTDLYIKVNKLENTETQTPDNEFSECIVVSDSSQVFQNQNVQSSPDQKSKVGKKSNEPKKETEGECDVARSAKILTKNEMLKKGKPKKSNKTLTPKTRNEVLKRDKCCQFKNPETGEVCGETSFVQVDHITPQWAGGTHEIENLQVLCANHNRRKYRKEAQMSWL